MSLLGRSMLLARRSNLLTYGNNSAPRVIATFRDQERLGCVLETSPKNPTAINQKLLLRLCHNLTEDQGDREVYRGILSTQIKLVKTFSLCTSMIGLACQPVLYNLSTSGTNLAIVVASGAFLSFFTFVTPVLIHFISKKYVTKLYYNQVEDKYTAYVYNIFVRPKKIEFKVTDVNVPDIPGMFTTFKAKNVPLFVEGSQFWDPAHYGKIMGYDKPLDLKWDKELNMTKSEADAVRRKNES